MAFTDSALQVAQLKLDQMFASPTISQTELKIGAAATARALLAKQRSRTVPRLIGDKVTGVEAWFIRPAASSNANTTAPADCDVPAGSLASTVKASYSSSVLVRSKAKVLDNRSDNLIVPMNLRHSRRT